MSEQASYLKLGLFVIVATGMLLTGITLLGAGAFFKNVVKAETYMEESVEGLDSGAPVKHRGVTIGKVGHIGFVSAEYSMSGLEDQKRRLMRGYVRVEIDLDPKVANREKLDQDLANAVHSGLRARLTTAGLMGSTFVELITVDPQENPPLEIGWTPKYPYIPATKSVMGQISSAAERIAGQLENADISKVVEDVDVLLVNLNKRVAEFDVSKMQNAAVATLDELRVTNKRIVEILNNPAIDSTVGDLAKTAARLKSASAQVDEILSDPQTKKMIADVGKMTESASPAVADLRRVARRLDTLLAAQQDDITAIISSLRRTMQNFDALADDASKNPSRVFFGQPPPRTESPAASGDKK